LEKIWQKTFKLHSKSSDYRGKIKWSLNYIQHALKECRKPYISFSGGKDSIVMTHLIYRIDPEILLYHHHQGEYMPEEIWQEIYSIIKRLAKNIEIRPFEENLWDDIIPDFLRRGFDGSFIGLRKEESVSRRERIKANRSLTELREYWPIQNWTWIDVWAYIIEHNLPYPSTYNKYGPLLGWDKVRFHSFFDPRMDKFGLSNIDGILMWRFRNKK